MWGWKIAVDDMLNFLKILTFDPPSPPFSENNFAFFKDNTRIMTLYEKLPWVAVPFWDHGHHFHRYSLVSWQVLEAEETWIDDGWKLAQAGKEVVDIHLDTLLQLDANVPGLWKKAPRFPWLGKGNWPDVCTGHLVASPQRHRQVPQLGFYWPEPHLCLALNDLIMARFSSSTLTAL